MLLSDFGNFQKELKMQEFRNLATGIIGIGLIHGTDLLLSIQASDLMTVVDAICKLSVTFATIFGIRHANRQRKKTK